ncbi:MAG: helicase-related protein, partial [Caldimonas sp.]
GLRTNALHGDKSQDERLKALEAFKAGSVDILVATDVAARGLDIVDLPAVFNFDVPYNAEDYIHRIGRTGRAGASGLAITLVSRDDNRLVDDIEKLIKKKIEIEPFELDDDAAPRRAPRERSRDDEDFRPPPKAVVSPYSVRTPGREVSAPPPASRDPFFDKPYEASPGTAEPAWEKRATPVARGLSPNIKPKQKVAALFGGKVPETTA